MTYQLNQDAHQSTALGAQAQAVLIAQARVAKASVEMREATDAYSAALATYETAKRREGFGHAHGSNDSHPSLMNSVAWCYCFGTPEPTGPWAFPDDVHADTCGFDHAPGSSEQGSGDV